MELIKELEALKPELVDYAEMVGSPVPSSYGIRYVYTDPSGYILDEAIKQLKENSVLHKCSGYYMERDKPTPQKGGASYHKVEFTNAILHQFGSAFEEFESGAGNYSTAIVELENGQVVEAVVNSIKFER